VTRELVTWVRSRLATQSLEHRRVLRCGTASLLLGGLSRLPEATGCNYNADSNAIGMADLTIARPTICGHSVGAGLGAALVTSFCGRVAEVWRWYLPTCWMCAALSHAVDNCGDRLDRTAYRYAGISGHRDADCSLRMSGWCGFIASLRSIGIVVALALRCCGRAHTGSALPQAI